VNAGGFQHQAADQIVDEEVQSQFPLNILGILAAELVHLERGLEIAQAHLHFPAAIEELTQIADGIAFPVEECGNQGDFASTEARTVDSATNEAKSEFGWQLLPKFVGNGWRLQSAYVPEDEALVGRESLPAAEVPALGAPGSDNRVNSAMNAEGEYTPKCRSLDHQGGHRPD